MKFEENTMLFGSDPTPRIVAIEMGDTGTVKVYRREQDGSTVCDIEPFHPFVWADGGCRPRDGERREARGRPEVQLAHHRQQLESMARDRIRPRGPRMMLACSQTLRDSEDMRHRHSCLIGAMLAAILPMTLMAETPEPGASGIEGTVLLSPNRPGPITRDRPNIGPAPNVQFLVKAGDATVKTFTTDAEGRFQIALPPGHYVILREDAGARIGHWRFEAEVTAGEMTKVNWTADSGMR